MQTRTKRIHFLVSPAEEAQIHQKMSETRNPKSKCLFAKNGFGWLLY